jgi:acyl-homoserine-lactone acylase
MRRVRSVPLLLLLALVLPSCATVGPRASAVWRGVFPDADTRTARRVTIHRDGWGVPHIYGATDASVVFGMAYAMAEDNFWQVEEDFITALGRTAQLYGEAGVLHDVVRAALEVERLSREEYAREPRERRALWDAFAAGLNHWLRQHPEVRPRLIQRFEPWFAFARFRGGDAGTVIDGVRLADVWYEEVGRFATPLARGPAGPRAGAPPVVAMPDPFTEPAGSNAWAIAPSRTASGHALLFANPHVGFFGTGQRYEVHLHSDAGWHFSGFAILGTPVPRSGRNERLGWSHTNTAADAADAWRIDFPDPAEPLAYRYGAGRRQAVEWLDTVFVRTDNGVEGRVLRFRRTHHGPLVRLRDGGLAAVRIARFEEGGALQQWYAMGRATTLEAFRTALAATALPISNTTYADADGNIMFVQGNAVPRRSTAFDWTAPVDGADPATEWQGYHALDELPQYLNPGSGWLQNTNSTPYRATADGHNLQPADYPSYMARESDNGRARISRRILASDSAWTLARLEAAAFDRRIIEAEDHVPAIIEEWERLGVTRYDLAEELDDAIEALRNWDGVAATSSEATTLFVLWHERWRARDADDDRDWPRTAVLGEVVRGLRAGWGTDLVPWGDVNRLQRVHTGGREPFDDDAPSLPVAGAPGAVGIIFNIAGRPGPDGRRRYGVSGHTWVAVMEFGPNPNYRSVVTFGQSADPASPHFFDQAALMVAGRMKDAWMRRDDVEREALRTYHPLRAR